jgi:hypothetical protein
MLLPSVAIAIAINYFGKSLTPSPTTSIVLTAVFFPSTAIALLLWWQARRSGMSG